MDEIWYEMTIMSSTEFFSRSCVTLLESLENSEFIVSYTRPPPNFHSWEGNMYLLDGTEDQRLTCL